MLKRILKSPCMWAVAGTVIGMAALWLVSFIFGLSHEICPQGSGAQNGNCPRYNLLFFSLWHLTEITNWLSPALTALATIAVGYFTWTLWQSNEAAGKLAERGQEHFRVTERAYVKMSHFSPGIEFVQNMGAIHIITSIRVKNFGHTPAHVTDVYVGSLITAVGAGLPDIPEYPPIEGREIAAAFLVADDEFVHHVDFAPTHAETEAVQNGTADLYIIGYVDYRDKFGDRHRGAYARLYDSTVDWVPANMAAQEAFANRNNLTIVSDGKYNDDRFRVHGEGVDWD